MDKYLSVSRLSKTSFTEKFDKAVKFYDYAYHMQKATYKGLSAFYKDYGKV